MKKHFQFTSVQYLNSDIKSVWKFACSPKNLKKFTPDYMLFNITSEIKDKMYPGMIISYQVAPILKSKLNWVTEITHVIENKFFVYEHRIGPYALWHHQNLFEVVDKHLK